MAHDGTVMLKDIASGNSSSFPSSFTSFGNDLYFHANNGVTGSELWKTDGTINGTVMVRDIYSGIDDSDPSGMIVFKDKLIFKARDAVNGAELWETDGTTAGTVMIRNIRPLGDSSSPSNFAIFAGRLYFGADDGVHGNELWVYGSRLSWTNCQAGEKIIANGTSTANRQCGNCVLGSIHKCNKPAALCQLDELQSW